MMEDETPLWKISWERFKKKFPPLEDETDSTVLLILWRQRSAIFRALLFTAAMISVMRFGRDDIVQLITKSAALVQPVQRYWFLASSALLIVAALFWQWIDALWRCFWRWNYRWRFVPMFVGVAVATLWWCGSPGYFRPDNFWMAAGMLFLCAVYVFWEKSTLPLHLEDHLQREYFVERLAEHLSVRKATLRRIAIIGSWGSGKTTVLELLKSKLAAVTSTRFKIAMVNPWKASTPEQAWKMLAKGFDAALGVPVLFRSRLSESPALEWLVGLKSLSYLSKDLLKLFRGDAPDVEARLVQSINRRLEAEKATVVILVDDMERADPEVIRKMFPVIDRLGEIEHCFFIFAIDPTRVAKAFKEDEHGEAEAKGYLDKVLDLQIELPEPRTKDVAALCGKRINPHETPKLAAAFPSISEFLPTNPRALNHFLNDARTKEIFFLSRFGPDEHEYADFFLLRMLELEAPRLQQQLLGDAARETRSGIYTANLMGASGRGGKTKEQWLEGAWNAASKFFKGPDSKIKRLKSIYTRVLTSGLDLRWAIHDHMRRLTPTFEEREAFENCWLEMAGHLSLPEMLHKALPGKSFTDQQSSAEELIRDEVNYYDELRVRVADFKSEEQEQSAALEASNIAERLLAHLTFAAAAKWDFDERCFRSGLFLEWLRVICRSKLSGRHPEMVKLERKFHIKLSDQLSNTDRYQFARFSATQIVDIKSLGPGQEECMDHLGSLREHMLLRVRDYIFECLSNGTANSPELCDELQVESPLDIFCNPTNWLPQDGVEGLGVLRSFAQQAESSAALARSFADVSMRLVNGVGSAAQGVRADRADLLLAMLPQHPQYFSTLWTASLNDKSTRNELLKLREKLQRVWTRDPGRGSEVIDAAFPIPQVGEGGPPSESAIT